MRTALLLVILCLTGFSQELMRSTGDGAHVSLYYTDNALFESGERRRDLPCEVKFIKPQLGFDLKFYSGYLVTFPFSELESDELALITRVVPHRGEPTYLVQRVRMAGPRPADGIGGVQGVFSVGEGSYTVNVVTRDVTGRVCSDFSEIATERLGKDVDLAIEPGGVSSSERDPFTPVPATARPDNALPAVHILLNFAAPARMPLNVSRNSLSVLQSAARPAMPFASVEATESGDAAGSREADVFALISMVRQISRHASPAGISLTVFNLEQRKVLYRQDGEIDFSALGEAIQAFRPGTIELDALMDKEEGTAKFLAGLLESGSDAKQHPPVIVISASDGVPDNFSAAAFSKGRELRVSYLHYNPNPVASQQYGDATGKAVKILRGKKYEIGQPKDLLSIWPDLISRLRR